MKNEARSAKNERTNQNLSARVLAFALACCLMAGCAEDDGDSSASLAPDEAVKAALSEYVAFGGTLTSGFMDSSLYASAQRDAYPALIARAMEAHLEIMPGFGVPTVPTETGYNPDVSNPLFPFGRIGLLDPGCPELPFDARPLGTTANRFTFFDPFPGEFENYAAPGMTAQGAVSRATTLEGDFLYNRYYARLSPSPGLTAPAEDVAARRPQFLTVMLGLDEVLNYATSGGAEPLPEAAEFEEFLNAALDTMMAEGAFGLIAQLPDLADLPFFYSVNEDLTVPSRRACLDGLTAPLQEGATYRIETFDGQTRDFDPATDVILPTVDAERLGDRPIFGCGCVSAGQGDGLGTDRPIPNRFVLDAFEWNLVRERLAQYNAAIARAAARPDLDLFVVDLEAAFSQLAASGGRRGPDGLRVIANGVAIDGAFSLDGLFPNKRGHAFVANAFLARLNDRFGLSVPLYDPTDFPANPYPSF